MSFTTAIVCKFPDCTNLADGTDKEGTPFCKYHAPAGGIELNIAHLRERLTQAEALLKRVVDKEQAKYEMQGWSLFRTPNALLAAIQAFLKDGDEQEG